MESGDRWPGSGFCTFVSESWRRRDESWNRACHPAVWAFSVRALNIVGLNISFHCLLSGCPAPQATQPPRSLQIDLRDCEWKPFPEDSERTTPRLASCPRALLSLTGLALISSLQEHDSLGDSQTLGHEDSDRKPLKPPEGTDIHLRGRSERPPEQSLVDRPITPWRLLCLKIWLLSRSPSGAKTGSDSSHGNYLKGQAYLQ